MGNPGKSSRIWVKIWVNLSKIKYKDLGRNFEDLRPSQMMPVLKLSIVISQWVDQERFERDEIFHGFRPL